MADMYYLNKEGSMYSCLAKETPKVVYSPMQSEINKFKGTR